MNGRPELKAPKTGFEFWANEDRLNRNESEKLRSAFFISMPPALKDDDTFSVICQSTCSDIPGEKKITFPDFILLLLVFTSSSGS